MCGWSQEEKKFVFKEEWENEDKLAGESNRKRMSNEICKAMNSVYSFLKFTVETEEDFPQNNRLPSLDTQLWMEDVPGQKRQKINFSFFEKSMKTPFCIMKDSAMSERTKISILSQDLIRRMLNTSETVPDRERVEIIDTYIDRLVVSGYCPAQVKEIVESGLTGYLRKVQYSKKNGLPLHRSAASTLAGRYRKKLTEDRSWYKKKGMGQKKIFSKKRQKNTSSSAEPIPVVSVMFCPQSRHGELARRLREAEKDLSKITRDSVKITERSGVKLRHLLCRSNPFAGEKCSQSESCLVCSNPLNKTYNCGARNITYKTVCLKCIEESKANDETEEKKEKNEEKKEVEEASEDANDDKETEIKYYFGESHRSAKERQKEHSEDYLKKREDSHQYKHLTEAHPGCQPEDVKWGMTVIRQHPSAFHRQVFEACLIFLAGKNVHNSRSQYNRCQVPRLSVMLGEDTPVQPQYDPAELEKELKKLRQKHALDTAPPAASAATTTTTTTTTTTLPPPSKKKKKWHVYSKWKRKRQRTKTGSAPSDTDQGVDTKRPKLLSPIEPGDHVDNDTSGALGKSTRDPSVSDIGNTKSNKKNENSNIFPIFHTKKANINFTSTSKAPVFAAKKNLTESKSQPTRKRTATATKKPKSFNLKGDNANTILKYLNTFQGTS